MNKKIFPMKEAHARVNPGTDENVTFPILPASVKIAVGNLAAARA